MHPAHLLPTGPRPLQVQFHAVALMHSLRANDRLAISKLVTQLTRSSVRSPMAQCLLVRYVAQVRVRGGAWVRWVEGLGLVGAGAAANSGNMLGQGGGDACCASAAGSEASCPASVPSHAPNPWAPHPARGR